MLARRLAAGCVLGTVLLTSSLPAFADDPAPPPAVEPAAPPTVAIDTSDPVCHDSSIVCEQAETPAIDITAQLKAMGPILRELRRCFDREGLQTTASVKIKWGSNTLLQSLEVAQGVDNHICVTRAKAKLADLRSNTPVTLSCRYECKGGVIAPVVPVAPPAPPPPPSQEPPRKEPLTEMAPPPDATPSTSSSSGGSTWYGWQTLVADGASATMLGIGLGSWTVEPTVIGYAGFVLATPIVHAINGNYGKALASFGLRVILPALAGAIGAGINVAANGEETTAKGVVTSAGIGMGLAAGACVLIDVGLLAWKSEEHRSGKARARPFGSF